MEVEMKQLHKTASSSRIRYLCFCHRVRGILYGRKLVGKVEAVLLAGRLQYDFAVPEDHEARVT